MTVLVGAIVGYVAGRLVWVLLRPLFNEPTWQRSNYRNIEIPTAVGIVIPIAAVLIAAGREVLGRFDVGNPGGADQAVVLLGVLGFACLGVVDDLAGGTAARGFAGHLGSLLRGQMTSGGLKLFGGGLVALVVASTASNGGVARLLIDAAVIALASNLLNLFDTAPGRSLKWSALLFLVLFLMTGADDSLVAVAGVIGAGLALLLDDLHERMMLGDSGANVLGAALGIGIVLSTDTGGRAIALIVLVALNLISEFVSFSRVIDNVPPLRRLDRAGRGAPPQTV